MSGVVGIVLGYTFLNADPASAVVLVMHLWLHISLTRNDFKLLGLEKKIEVALH